MQIIQLYVKRRNVNNIKIQACLIVFVLFSYDCNFDYLFEVIDFSKAPSTMMITCKYITIGRTSLRLINKRIKCIIAPISSVRKSSTDIKQKRIGIIGMGQVGKH